MKLHTKIVGAFTICICVSFLILLYTVQDKMVELNENQTENFNQQIVQSKANEVGVWLYQRVCELRMLSQYDELVQDNTDFEQENVAEYVHRLNNRLKELFGNTTQTFTVVNKNGVGWTEDNIRLDVSDREYFLEAVAMDETREYSMSKPLISKIDGKRTIFICYPVRDRSGDKVCYILGAVPVARLEDAVSAIRIFDGSVWIMDRYGRVISEDSNHNHTSMLCPKELSLTKTATELQQSNSGVRIFDTDSIEGHLIYSAIPYTDGWRLCVLAQNDVIYAETKEVQKSIIAVWIVLLILSISLCILFSNHIVNPVKRLRAAMGEVERGNFLTTFEAQDNHDEVSQLGHSFNSMVEQIQALLEKVMEEQKEKRGAELKALQAQINPHFLYNTLDTLQWKALEHDAIEVADIVNALSGFFRVSLSDGKERITLNEEVEHAYYYLFIQQTRYRDKIDFDIRLEESLENYPIIKIVLQPFIENAIYHGIKPANKKGTIKVEISLKDEFIYLCIIDNGVGMSKDKLDCLLNGIHHKGEQLGYGIYNVNERLRLTYGEAYQLIMESELNFGTMVTLKIPYDKEEENVSLDNCR